MIKKLQIKIVAITMGSLLAVLGIIMGCVNLLNYRQVVTDADTMLNILEEFDGAFPNGNFREENPQFQALSPEAEYETRFFTITADENGNITAVNTGQVAAIDSETAAEYAKTILEKRNARGFIDSYRYTRSVQEDGTVLIVCLDCRNGLSNFWDFLKISCTISLAGLLVVLVLVTLLSKKIVQPVTDSYDKQKQFITDAGHEIKTPLAIINADADILEMDLGENEWLTDIQKQTERLSELTTNLINLSKMEESEDFTMLPFPISDVVSETVGSFGALAKTQNKSFRCDIQPMLSVTGDEKAIRQLVGILLDNALKYSGENGEISVSLKKQGRGVVLSVYNTAESVNKESLEHLFDRFYRADKSRNFKISGYGIGLSIAKVIVTAHKGKITATTEDEKSLTMTVTLPR